MTSFKLRAAGVAALFFSSLAFAAPPAVPTVTVGADLKQLRFDVEPVSGASFYRLWFRANGGAAWVKYFETIDADPVFKVTVSTHLIDWYNARYKVSACNSSGCGTTSDIYVTNTLRDTVGYFKPRAGALQPQGFGQDVALSADGKAFAVMGGETIGPRANSAVVSIFRKGASGWTQEARLVPSLVEANTGYGALAINGDGTVVALGLPTEFALFPGHAHDSGAVYVFRRTGTTWAQEAKFAAPGTASEALGAQIALDDAGETLVVGRDPNQNGPVDIYRHGANDWTLDRSLPTANLGTACSDVALSGDGHVLVRHCNTGTLDDYVEIRDGASWTLRQRVATGSTNSALALSFDGSLIVTPTSPKTGATWTPWMMVLRRTGATWQADPAFTHVGKARNPPTGIGSYGEAVAISRDGRFVAVGDSFDRNGGVGAVRGPLTVTAEYTGAVFIYQRKADAWALRNMIKPNVAVPRSYFGHAVEFGDDGKVLAVGAYGEDSAARGIDGDQNDTSAPDSGAAWLY